jgi:acetyl esterase/lipase
MTGRSALRRVWFVVWIGSLASLASADDELYTRQNDIIYGRKHGMALTMDAFVPKAKANGGAVVWVQSGGWHSTREHINVEFYKELLTRGYTVFAVMHGSQPKYTIPEAIDDMKLSIRYLRLHAADFKIDPNRIGVSGGSAGGHLSLMLGTAADTGDPKSDDPIARTSGRVQAVGCYFPPTDFLNYGTPGFAWLNRGPKDALKAPFDFQQWNPELKIFEVVDEPTRVKIGQEISPVNHVTKDDPPTLIIHGDKDALVPLEQSQRMIDLFNQAGVPCELVVKKGAGHGWDKWHDDMRTIADWFDKYLKPSESVSQAR